LYRYSAEISCSTASPRYSRRSLSRGDASGFSFAYELWVSASCSRLGSRNAIPIFSCSSERRALTVCGSRCSAGPF
jgi:hypothetical protein